MAAGADTCVSKESSGDPGDASRSPEDLVAIAALEKLGVTVLEGKGAGKRARPEPPPRHLPPQDGGARAWMVLFASFLTNGIVFGVINSYSVIYVNLQEKLESAGVVEASSKASLVGSLTIGCTFAFSPVAGVLTDHFGIRPTAIVGGCLAAIGMISSSFLCHSVEALYFTYGVLFGAGSSLAYTPSLAVLPLHFNRRLGLANGIVTAGSSVFTVALPLIMGWLINHANLETTLQAMAGLVALIPVCATWFKHPRKVPAHETENALAPPESTSPILSSSQVIFKEKKSHFLGINFEIWRRKKYVIWALAIPSALFGYFVPYVHMVKFVNINFPESDGKLLVMCIGLTSGLGRLVFGKIADMPRVDRIFLQQISFVSIGSLTMLLVATNSFHLLTVIALGMGLFDGCFISLLGPISFDLCGTKGATQAIGFLLGLCSIPLTVGPPIAGAIFDHSGSYTLPFLLAGVPPIIGAGVMFLVRCVKTDEEKETHLQKGNIIVNEDRLQDTRGKEANGDIICIKNRRSGSIGINCLEAGLYWRDKSFEQEKLLWQPYPKRYSAIL